MPSVILQEDPNLMFGILEARYATRIRDKLGRAGEKLSEGETAFWAELTEALDSDGLEDSSAEDVANDALLAELAEVYAANERAAEARRAERL